MYTRGLVRKSQSLLTCERPNLISCRGNCFLDSLLRIIFIKTSWSATLISPPKKTLFSLNVSRELNVFKGIKDWNKDLKKIRVSLNIPHLMEWNAEGSNSVKRGAPEGTPYTETNAKIHGNECSINSNFAYHDAR